MPQNILTLALCLFIPLLIYYYRFNLQRIFKLDYILLAYAFGIAIKFFTNDFFSKTIIQAMIYISIPLAMPLLIFQADFWKWLKNAPLTVITFLIACFTTCIVGYVLGKYFIHDETGKKIISMLVGVYIGGTPNLNAIGLSLKAPLEVMAVANTMDLMASSLYLFFMLFFAKPLLKKFLSFPTPFSKTHEFPSKNIFEEKHFHKILPLLISFFILAISIGLSYILFQELKIPFIMLVISLLGILGSMKTFIRNLSMNENYGNFLITVFCFSTGLMIDPKQILSHVDTLFFASVALIFLSFILQVMLGKTFKINGDIVMICSVACVMSPAFIPMFVKHLGNDELLLPGITAGLAGFALGNLFGITIYFLI